MSIARLDEALDRLAELSVDRPDLQRWVSTPSDGAIIDRLVAEAAPWRFADEHLHMARRGGFFPGYRCWADWSEWGMPEPTVEGELEWQEDMREDYGDGRGEPVVKWVEYATSERYFVYVPLLAASQEEAPVAFSEGIDSIDIVFPSLATMLESFAATVEALQGNGLTQDVSFDEASDFDFFWWSFVHGSEGSDVSPTTEVLAGRLAEIGTGFSSDHPVWQSLGRTEEFGPGVLWL